VDFTAAKAAAARFAAAGVAVYAKQTAIPADPAALNKALRDAEGALLDPEGLPKRSWYRHTIYAPGEFTGYAAVVIPGVNEAIEVPDAARTRAQLGRLTEALDRASAVLEAAAK
jgi:N-acetylated-alpha-linked acidic dipeptidase